VPGLTTEKVIACAEDALCREKNADPRFSGTFTALNNRRAIEISDTHPMTTGLRAILKAQGYGGEKLGINFFTDASVLDREDQKRILLFGPGEPFMAHKPNEYVEIAKYEDAITVLQEFAKTC